MAFRKYYGEKVFGNHEGGAPRLTGYDVYIATDVEARLTETHVATLTRVFAEAGVRYNVTVTNAGTTVLTRPGRSPYVGLTRFEFNPDGQLLKVIPEPE